MNAANKATTDALKVLLSDTYVLYIKVHGFHYNVVGPTFVQLHELFGDIYDDLGPATDQIAECIRTLDCVAPGSMREFDKLTNIKESVGKKTTSRMIAELARDQDVLIQCIKDAFDVTPEDDLATVDLLSRRMAAHQKQRWFLKSLME